MIDATLAGGIRPGAQFCPPIGAPARPPVLGLERQMVVAEALAWLGTPYHHRARVKGQGVDCAQLLAAVYESTGVATIGDLPEYSPDWYLHRSDELLTGVLERYAVQLRNGEHHQPGDIVTFTFGRQVSHAGIVIAGEQMVHALAGRNVTLEAYGQHTPYASRFAGVWRPRRWAE